MINNLNDFVNIQKGITYDDNMYFLSISYDAENLFIVNITLYANDKYLCMKCSQFNSALYGIWFVMIPYNLIELHHFSLNQSLYTYCHLMSRSVPAYILLRCMISACCMSLSTVRGCSHPLYVNQLQ